MSFKDDYMEDLDEVFFDEDVFADRHTIDGQEITCIVEQESLETYEKLRNRNTLNTFIGKENDINMSSITIYIRDKEVHRKFTVNSAIQFDTVKLFILSVNHQPGMYKLTVGTHLN